MHREFIEMGYRIFPLWPFNAETGECACGNAKCVGAGKHPRASNWQNTPEWDEEQIEAMEAYSNLANGYGVLCKGLLVIDVDARNGGIASYEKMIVDFPEILGSGFVVETGSGGGSRHIYFSLPEGVALVSHLPQYKGIDVKTTGFVVGPGSKHLSGRRYVAGDGSPYDITEAPQSLIDALRKPDRHRTEYNGQPFDVSHEDIANLLAHIPNDDLIFEDWIRVGMAVHQSTNGTGYELWRSWSETCPSKHKEDLMPNRWHSFGRSSNPVTIGTLIFHAEKNGWAMPVTFTPTEEFPLEAETEHETTPDGLPFDISGCDLKSPPGFVGDLAKWIESQSRRPRVNLSVATALTAMGNIAGLRYIDEKDRVTGNLLTFCIAGSRTGKESALQALSQIHRIAGLAAATHGAIKSEQEIVKNLIRHQAAFYAIDEIGIFLQKVQNAQKRGGAIYLDGVIGMIMSAFSKADGFMLLTGDQKDEIRKQLMGELSAYARKLDDEPNNRSAKMRMEAVTRQLEDIDNGLERPFLSLVGFTTPVTFDALVDFQSATNGFIGRALLFNERDTAPRSKKDFARTEIPKAMEATLMQIASGGSFDSEKPLRIENYGDRISVPSEAKAIAMLNDALDWLEDQAIAHKGKSGLESLYLGAYELVSKVSFILAIPEGLRTSEHVRWAFSLVKRDVEEKIRLVTANDREKESPGIAMQARISNLCSGEDGETLGVIYNRMRGKTRNVIDSAIEDMEKRGLLEKLEVKHAKTGKPYVRLRYRGGD